MMDAKTKAHLDKKLCFHKNQFHDGKEVRLVRMKSKKDFLRGGNVYDGEILWMCRGCRTGENGQFKYMMNFD